MKNYNSPKVRKEYFRQWIIFGLFLLIIILVTYDFNHINIFDIIIMIWLPLLATISFSNRYMDDDWCNDLQKEIEDLKREIDKLKINS